MEGELPTKEEQERFKEEVKLSNPDYTIEFRGDAHWHTTDPGVYGFTADVTDNRTGKTYTVHIDPYDP